jgi:glycerol-3-phosphate acyltransferase PlsY
VIQVVIWSLVAFLSGSIPFSVVVGRLAANVDIRDYGDRNPGATNVMRATGWGWFVPASLLDYFKGVIPVGFAWFFLGINGWRIIPIALAPVVGHAYSPWLRFRGGKALAATFGAWTGLTLGAGPILLGLLLGLMMATVVVSGWAVMLAMLGFGAFVWTQYSAYAPELMVIWLANLLILGWKHRQDLVQPPGIQPWLLSLVRRWA